MVFYFTLTADPGVTVYMGRDKYENEELIKWGWPEDIWFHVDEHSSAHVYVRLPRDQSWDTLSPEVVEECCQLVKANSIEGCKLTDVRVVYTPWSNLKKTQGMDVGQVGFHKESLRKYYTVREKKDTACLKRLEKTRIEKNEVDFRALREARDAEERQRLRAEELEAKRKKAEEEAAYKKAAELKSYSTLMDEKKMTTNTDGAVPDDDDFM